ncbi:MAG TPA: hypothetical protein VLX44_03525 [Xanthobacteraceae bacterium]|nr:hypothetical protein [Xanthobacteraceae bacterium]
MATLTTTGGATITFNPAGIDAIADHNDTTGAAVTCVYGIPPSMLMVGETVPALLQRLKIEQDFAQLTRPNGWPVWIRGSSVTAVRPPAPGEYPAAVQSIVSTSSLTQAVKETPAEVTAALDARGGNL